MSAPPPLGQAEMLDRIQHIDVFDGTGQLGWSVGPLGGSGWVDVVWSIIVLNGGQMKARCVSQWDHE